MNKVPKLLFIACYFGDFPWYFPLFLKSCEFNPNVDFNLYADRKWEGGLPVNVQIIHCTLEGFNQQATRKLGFKVSVKKPYKLCDFKPAYGVIFQELIDGYDFWGITDIDIVFGRIREFITIDLLENYELISVRHDYPTGFFMLFKNIEKINSLFKKSKDFKRVFQSDIHYCFDECNFKHIYLHHNGDIFELDCEIESMHHIIKKEEKRKNLKAYFDFLIIEGLPGQLKWGNGILTFKNEFEVLLHHLIQYKSHHYTRKAFWKRVPDTFYIDEYLVRRKNENLINRFFVFPYLSLIRPYIFQKLFRLEFYFSKLLSIDFEEAKKEEYIFNGTIITLSEDENKQYKVSFNSSVPIRIFKAIFTRKGFFAESIPKIKYKLIDKNKKLIESYHEGHFYIYDRLLDINEKFSIL